MGLREAFRRLTSPERPELRDPNEVRAFLTSNTIPGPAEGYGSDSGLYVSERTALQHLAVLACVRLLADSIASLPMDVYRKEGSRRVPLPTPRIIGEPDDGLTEFEYVQQVITSLALRGNSYEVVTGRDALERPIGRMPVHPDDIHVTRNRADGRADFRIDDRVIPRSDILHIRRLTLAGQITGLSPIEQARQGIGLSLAAERYGARWFGDSANPSSVLETEANLVDVEAQRVMKSWVSSHGGRRHPAVLSGGLHYRPISIPPNESQFLETRQFQRSEIAMMYGIPPHMIGDTEKTTSWGTGIEQQSIGFVKFTLLPWLRCVEAAYSRALLPRGQFVRFNLDGLLRGDVKSRYEAYTQGRTAGWLNVDEIRALEDMEPVPGGLGQGYLQPLNMGPLGSDPLAVKTEGVADEEE